jgi:pilus assembly protein CpaF
MNGLAAALHRAVVDGAPAWTALPTEVRRDRLTDAARELAPLMAPGQVAAAVDSVLALVGGLGPLEPVLADRSVTDVMVNGDGAVYVERRGRIARLPITLTEPEVLGLIERVVAPLGLRVDRSSPVVDARLADGTRINAIVPPVAVDGPCLTIRRFSVHEVRLDDFADGDVAALLRWAIVARCNVLVSGGTGAGKTTLLNALAAGLPSGERVVTLEDTAELRLAAPHVVRLEARPPNADGEGQVAIGALLRNALRMRPDRVLVGEVRGGEALDMLQAMNTGHEGSLSTCHANSPVDALRRLETMALMAAIDLPLAAIREQVAAGIDLVVHVARRSDGSRRVVAVDEVVAGSDEVGAPARLGAPRTRPLVSGDRVVALPARPVRAPGAAAPDPGWLREVA